MSKVVMSYGFDPQESGFRPVELQQTSGPWTIPCGQAGFVDWDAVAADQEHTSPALIGEGEDDFAAARMLGIVFLLGFGFWTSLVVYLL